MKTLLFSLMFALSFSSGAAQAQEACGTLFGEGLALSEGIFKKANQYDPTQVKELTARLLSMAQSTMGESITPKMTLEKNGKMILGQMLKKGWSLEAEYAQDARIADSFEKNSIFRLAEITIVRPNGEKIKVLKSPTNIYGDAFSKELLSNKELTGLEGEILFENLHEVSLPLTIEGPLWQSLSQWIPYIEFLPRSTLRDVTPQKLGLVKTQGYALDKWNEIKKIGNKQSLKYLLIGVAFYLYTERNNINIDFLLPDPWNRLIEISKETKLHAEEGEHLTQLLNSLLKSNVEQAAVFKTSAKEKYSSKLYFHLSDIIKNANGLANLEKKTSSKQHVYLFKKNKVSPFSLKKVSELLNNESEEPTLIIFHHPNMKRVWLVSANQTIEGDNDDVKYFTFALDANSDPEVYKMIKARLAPGERTLE